MSNSKTSAVALATAVVEQLYSRGILPDSSRKDELMGEYTVDRAVHDYIRRRGRLRSVDRYQQYFAHLSRHLGHRSAGRIRQAQIDDYLEARHKEKAAPKTAFNELSLLRSCLLYAWRNDELRDRPKFTLSRPRSQRSRVLWPHDAKRLFLAADVPLRRFMLACYTMGLRRGEAMSMLWDWVDMEQQTVLIPGEFTKTQKSKTVCIGDELMRLLFVEPVSDRWVFCRLDKDGHPTHWTKEALRHWFVKAKARADIVDLTIHDLRRSYATVGLDRGHSQKVIEEGGGWLTPGIVATHYLHPRRQQIAAVTDDLEEALALSKSG